MGQGGKSIFQEKLYHCNRW